MAAIKKFILNSIDDLKIDFSVIFEIYPDIDMPCLKSVDIKRKKVKASEEDFNLAESIIIDNFSKFESANVVDSNSSIVFNCSAFAGDVKLKQISFCKEEAFIFKKSPDLIVEKIKESSIGKASKDKVKLVLCFHKDNYDLCQR